MSGYTCIICGKTHNEVREWRHCPLYGSALICGTEHCKECEHFRAEEDVGTLWCTYHHGRAIEESHARRVERLKSQIRITSNDIRELYRRNYKNKAKQRELDLIRLTAELRRIENK